MGLGPPHTYLLLRGRIEKPAASPTLPAVELYAGKVKDPNRLLSSTVVDPAHVRPQDLPPPPMALFDQRQKGQFRSVWGFN